MKSMTGFGKSTYIDDNYEIQVEIKSFNYKTYEIKTIINRELSFLENEIKDIVFNKIKRGKVELRVTFRDKQIPEFEIDENRVKAYYDMLLQMKNVLNITEEIKLETILQDPDMVIIKKNDFDTEDFRNVFFYCIEEALEKHQLMALKEGATLLLYFTEALDTIEKNINEIKATIPMHKEKLQEHLIATIQLLLNSDFTPDVEKRILVETSLYLERCDITEELTRLNSHLMNIRLHLKKENEEIGRSMNFIFQEMQREANTVSSKYCTTNTFLDVLQMKEEIEKCREQIQNVE